MLYQDKYVAFIDMLGFSALVQESAADMSKLDEIAEAIDRLKNTACCNPATGLLFTYFSDCIVISSSQLSCWPCRHPELHQNVGREPASG